LEKRIKGGNGKRREQEIGKNITKRKREGKHIKEIKEKNNRLITHL
jgi:hypothetical protein